VSIDSTDREFAMKINDSGSIKKPATPTVASGSTAAKSTEKAGATSAASDSVKLSSQAQSLSAGASSAPFDAKKVAEIKAAIANGTFQIDASKIADGLIDSVRDATSTLKRK
jgi:negative regulator of flagellin synthesis FlgM